MVVWCLWKGGVFSGGGVLGNSRLGFRLTDAGMGIGKR
jgi:hypothetical protein